MHRPTHGIAIAALAAAAAALTAPTPTLQAQDTPEEPVADSVVYEGTFRSVAGHDAGGEYQVVRRGDTWVIKMLESFTTEKVPDGHVYFSDEPERLTRSAVHVGRLYQREGAHEYELPADLDPTVFQYLLVWCVRFDVGVAAGALAT